MAIQEILKMGDSRLLQKAEMVPDQEIRSERIQSIIADLFDTMRAVNGAGLAAPQIGHSLQIVLFGFEKNPRYPNAPAVPKTVLINPHITVLSNVEEEDWEGCLSVPGIRAKVPRFKRIRYQGLDEQGNSIDRIAEGFHARVVQHECDHLQGKLFPMRVKDFTHFGFTSVLFPGLDSKSEDA
jgi:peptide deformylase